MSNYALGAIQMLTPSTFRRRNVSTRRSSSSPTGRMTTRTSSKSKSKSTKSITKSMQQRRGRGVRNNNQTQNRTTNIKIGQKKSVQSMFTSTSTSALPNTLTFYDENNNTTGGSSLNQNNNNGINSNNNHYPMSQLTMSQLSDSKSYQHYQNHSHHSHSHTQPQEQKKKNHHRISNGNFLFQNSYNEESKNNNNIFLRPRPSKKLRRLLSSDNDNASTSISIWSASNENENDAITGTDNRRRNSRNDDRSIKPKSKSKSSRTNQNQDNFDDNEEGDYSLSQLKSQNLLAPLQSSQASLASQPRSRSKPRASSISSRPQGGSQSQADYQVDSQSQSSQAFYPTNSHRNKHSQVVPSHYRPHPHQSRSRHQFALRQSRLHEYDHDKTHGESQQDLHGTSQLSRVGMTRISSKSNKPNDETTHAHAHTHRFEKKLPLRGTCHEQPPQHAKSNQKASNGNIAPPQSSFPTSTSNCTSTSIPAPSTPAPSTTTTTTTRKRSWMEACIDVMKTPYRKGKSIAHTTVNTMATTLPLLQPRIKVDVDEEEEMENQVRAVVAAHAAARKQTQGQGQGRLCSAQGKVQETKIEEEALTVKNVIMTTTPPRASFETPFRHGRHQNQNQNKKGVSSASDTSAALNTDTNGNTNVVSGTIRSASSTPNQDAGSTTTPSIASTLAKDATGTATTTATAMATNVNANASNESNEEAKKVLQEAKDLWTQINAAKVEIETKQAEFEQAKTTILQEIRNEMKVVLQEKKTEFMDAIQSNVKVLHDNLDEKKDKFDVHFWSAEEKLNGIVCEFDVQQTEAMDAIKAVQSDVMGNVKAREDQSMQELETKLSSLDKAGKSTLEEIEVKRMSACRKIAKDFQGIQEKVESSLTASLRTSITAMVEDEKYKIGLYVRNEINRQTAGSLIESSTNDVEKDEKKKVINETLIPHGENTTEKVSHDSKDSKSTKNVSCDQGSTPSQVGVIKRVSPIQSESVSSEEFSKNDLERSASTSRLPKTKISSTQGKSTSRPTAVQASVIDAVSKRNSIKLVVPGGEDATSSLPPLSNVLTNRPGRGSAPFRVRRYNLRSKNDGDSSRVGTVSTEDVGRNISNVSQGIADRKTKVTNKTKKIVKKKSTSHKTKDSQIMSIAYNTELSANDKGNNSTNNTYSTTMRDPQTPIQATKQVSTTKKQRTRRRRRIGGVQKVSSYKVLAKDSSRSSSRSKATSVRDSRDNESMIYNSRSSRNSRGRIPSNNSAFRTPNYIPNALSPPDRPVLRQVNPNPNSPSGVDSTIFGPPPIPTLDGLPSLGGLARSPGHFIAPRRAFNSQFDFDTLSFQ